ncbi:MAG: hypothetical protein IJC79_04435 [Clostridia bacterium]|nr:hypothetical protein [Clostridia bacterium]
MKKFFVALMAVVLCFTMVMGAGAASDAVEAEPITTQAIPTTQSTEEVIGGFVSNVIDNNQPEVDNAVSGIESLSATIAKILDALDNFLRSLRLFVDQFLSNVLGNGSLPF